jgi:cysteine desulfurase
LVIGFLHQGRTEVGTLNVDAQTDAMLAPEQGVATIQTRATQIAAALLAQIAGLRINGRGAERLPNTSSLTFPGVEADALLMNLPSLMMGTGSACTSGAMEPSHVLTAIGLSRELASATVRLSLGRFIASSNLQRIVEQLTTAFVHLRQM